MHHCEGVHKDSSPVGGALTVAWITVTSTSLEGEQSATPNPGSPSPGAITDAQPARTWQSSATGTVLGFPGIGEEQEGDMAGDRDDGENSNIKVSQTQGAFQQDVPASTSVSAQGIPTAVKEEEDGSGVGRPSNQVSGNDGGGTDRQDRGGGSGTVIGGVGATTTVASSGGGGKTSVELTLKWTSILATVAIVVWA